ncbi:hypothetical protein E2493_17285 [Sphingomonas parva]|uniref:Uncharacterized protein n=1 Tax=Sphingomonas parva TaxID=2555898 RepID=A0A4Y8ZM05_9SPHN|nr:hypothetical protein [Sphingomonas parva]TFI56994.1 hypothetical protein E2493_17285 [Sphingomonas parva]
MTNSTALRDRAAQCRQLASDYHPDVAKPLIQKAEMLEREAARIERSGVERRREEVRWSAQRRPRTFGRSRTRHPVIERQAGILFPLWEPPRI